ncbi:S9 family peptidase [bacterium]|nr:S9 family peptidase [bacterium]
MIRISLLLMLLCEIVVSAETSKEKRPMTVEDMWAVKRIGAPSLSPDGQWAAVDVTTYDMKENNSTSDIWLIPTSGSGEPRQLTAHTAKDGGAQWSPDGKSIAFLSKREGDENAQIYLISASGGEARRLTKIPTGTASIKWFPDSKKIAFVSWIWPDLKTDEEQAAKLKEKKEAKVKAYVIDTTNFRYWDHWLADGRRAHLFVVDVATGQHQDLFQGTDYNFFWYENSTDLTSDYFDISPDGKEVAFMIDSTPDPGLDPNSDIIIMPLDGSKGTNITSENKASDTAPSYSPDGKWLAYTKQVIPRFYGDRERVVLRDRKSGESKVLTEQWDRSAGTPTWSADSKSLLFTAEDKARVPLWELKISGGNPVAIVPGGNVASFDLSENGKSLAYVRSNISSPGILYAASSYGKNERKIESFNDELVSQWELGEVKEMTYKGWGDEPVQMWVIHPPDFDPNKKWPLLHVVHGGPHAATLDQFHYRWNLQLLASRGFVVAGVNFHGSSGFGNAFTDSISGQYGTKELVDVEKGTDELLKTGYIDANRLTASGGSFGGYMMAWLNGHTDRYKAFVCHAGVYNWISQMASDIVVGRDRALGSFHWDKPEQVAAQSAHTYAKNFKTPTLVIHGEKDFRVPVTQGLEYYSTLRMLGVPTRLVYLEEENHWVLKPQTSKLWHQEFFNWIEKYAGKSPS